MNYDDDMRMIGRELTVNSAMNHRLPVNAPAGATGYYGEWVGHYPIGPILVRIWQINSVLCCVQRTDTEFTPAGSIRWQINTTTLKGLGVIEFEHQTPNCVPLHTRLFGITVKVINREQLSIEHRGFCDIRFHRKIQSS